MEPSAKNRVLGEPALLCLILSPLSQQELLRAQRVCQTWNRTISTDSRLLAAMWLHPGLSIAGANEAKVQINPLLQKTFPTIFKIGGYWDSLNTVVGEHTPFTDMWDAENPQILQMLNHPNASWRRMIPCFPAPGQLLVNVIGEERGKLLWLDFSNQNTQDMRPSHPPWLTFGLLYDIIECAWHRANPWRLQGFKFEFPIAPYLERKHRLQSAEHRAERDRTACGRPGRVRLLLLPDTRRNAERRKVHDEGVAEWQRRLSKTARIGLCGLTALIPKEMFTDEFHFADALSLDEIEWDETREYDRALGKPPAAQSSPRQPRRRFLGIRLWKRR